MSGDPMLDLSKPCPIPTECVSCNEPAGAVLLLGNTGSIATAIPAVEEVPTEEPDEVFQGKDLKLKGISGCGVRIDLVESRIYLAAALSVKLIRENFYAGKSVRVGVDMPNGEDLYFLELHLGDRGFEIETLDAEGLVGPVMLEMVAVIDSYRYLSAETAG